MNYKELIERLRKQNQSFAAYNSQELSYALEDAATALETLLAERDALMWQIRGHCSFCINRRGCMYDYERMRNCAWNGMSKWEWSGPAPDRKTES